MTDINVKKGDKIVYSFAGSPQEAIVARVIGNEYASIRHYDGGILDHLTGYRDTVHTSDILAVEPGGVD